MEQQMKSIASMLFLALPLGCGIMTYASAEDAITNLSGQKLDVRTITAALSARKPLTNRGTCKKDASLPQQLQCKPILIPKPVSFDQITFEFNSANLTPQAREVLNLVGASLASPE